MNIQEVLAKHKKWVENDEGGQCADLRGAYLRGANLQDADLRDADLRGANLWNASLQGADLQDADLQGANLWGADLWGADLHGADLRDADIDFSCWPLWCGSQSVKVNLRIVYQLLAHVACLECDEPEFQDIKKAIMPYALMSHRAADLDLIASERGQA